MAYVMPGTSVPTQGQADEAEFFASSSTKASLRKSDGEDSIGKGNRQVKLSYHLISACCR